MIKSERKYKEGIEYVKKIMILEEEWREMMREGKNNKNKYEKLENEKLNENSAKYIERMMKNDRLVNGD